jgi:transglutaminase-like putative cysteine protease
LEFNKKQLVYLPKKLNRIISAIRPFLGNWPDWIGLILLALTLGIVARSIQQAQWINPQPAFLLVLILALAFGFILAKSTLRALAATGLAALGGLLVTFWQVTIVLPSPSGANIFSRMAGSLGELWQTLSQSMPNEGTTYFAVFLVIFLWGLAFFCAWRLVRKQSVWYAVFLGLIALMINLNYLAKTSYGYFYLFIFAAILLVSYVHFIRQRFSFKPDFNAVVRGVFGFTALVLLLSAILVGTSWAAPEIKANQLQSLMDSKIQPGQTLNNLKINFFASVRAKGTIIKAEDQGSLYFSSLPNLSQDVQFIIQSFNSPAAYWRVNRYDIYNSWGWTTSPSNENLVGSGEPQIITQTAASQFMQTYTVTDKIKTNIVLTEGQFLSAMSPVIAHDFLLAGQAAGTNSTQSNQTAAGDQTVSIVTPHIYKPDDSYTITTVVTKPTVDQLKGAATVYPAAVTSQYLQLTPDLPQPVRRTANNATRRALTEYDKVAAILNYLSQFTYNIEGSTPALGVDEVYSFTNIQKTGNCTNFATAAVVLLRCAGVPARLATGYIPHYVDKTSGSFVIEARDSHAWPEVYFPGYGWIEFESTPPGAIAPLPDNTDNTASNPIPATGTFNNPLDFLPPYLPQTNASAQIQNNQPVSPSNRGPYVPLAITAAIIAALGVIVYLYLRKFKRRDYISDVFARLCFASNLVGVSSSPQQTPLEFGERLSAVLPGQKAAIDTIMNSFIISRFSRKKLLYVDEQAAITRSWHVILRGILVRRLSIWR